LGSCPQCLTAAAKAEWNRLLPELKRLGVLTVLDRACFAAYCSAWSDFRRASEELEKAGYIASSPNGAIYPHPAWRIKIEAMKQIRDFSAEFGLTPLARPRVPMPGRPEDDEDAHFFPGSFVAPPPPGRPPKTPA
jgi:P27 family predicted phage terminase small subunit